MLLFDADLKFLVTVHIVVTVVLVSATAVVTVRVIGRQTT